MVGCRGNKRGRFREYAGDGGTNQSYQTAQVDRNRYSVPTAYVGRWLWAHLGCDRVSFYADRRQVAEHPRISSNSQWQLNPLHYLDLLYQRVGAFESARPIRQWRPHWPGHYETMLERLRHRYGDNGATREFVGLLQEVASYHIRANSIAPGAIRTPINTSAWYTPEAYNSLMELIPYKRIGETEDNGRVAAWLASDPADYMTGASIFVDGGMTLYPGFATGG